MIVTDPYGLQKFGKETEKPLLIAAVAREIRTPVYFKQDIKKPGAVVVVIFS